MTYVSTSSHVPLRGGPLQIHPPSTPIYRECCRLRRNFRLMYMITSCPPKIFIICDHHHHLPLRTRDTREPTTSCPQSFLHHPPPRSAHRFHQETVCAGRDRVTDYNSKWTHRFRQRNDSTGPGKPNQLFDLRGTDEGVHHGWVCVHWEVCF